MNTTRYLMLALGILAACSCSRSEKAGVHPAVADGEEDAEVYTVNYPLQYFAQRIAGDRVRVVFPVPEDEDPAYWKPAGDEVAAFQQADLILMNGADYAKWAARVSLPSSSMVNTCAGQDEALIALDDTVTHTHGPGGVHEHGGMAFTTWLDAGLAVAQASVINDALAETWPEHADAFQVGFDKLKGDLLDLDAALSAAVPDGRAVRVVFSHPVYQYLARRYGLEGGSVHFEPDEEPSPEMWAELESLLEEAPARIMIWEGEPLPEVASRLAALGLTCVVFDPAGNVPEAGDYLEVMQANAARLAGALAE